MAGMQPLYLSQRCKTGNIAENHTLGYRRESSSFTRVVLRGFEMLMLSFGRTAGDKAAMLDELGVQQPETDIQIESI